MRQPTEAAVNELVDAVLLRHGITPEIAAAASTFTDRLRDAELQFRQGQSRGVSIGNVVNAVNQLASNFNAPAYAYTNAREVKRMRARQLVLSPQLVGAYNSEGGDKSLPTTMSPVEAFHIAAALSYQKIYNPEFQLTRAECDSNWASLNSQQRLQVAASLAQGRTEEMLSVVHTATAEMTYRDILAQSEGALNTLLKGSEGRRGP